MQRSTHILTGVGIAAIATALFSFSAKQPVKKEDEEKKKKYHVIHQKNGEMHKYDTIISMHSNYSVEDFLASKGIEDPNVKIVKIPSVANMAFLSNEAADTKVFVHRMNENIVVEEENGTREEVKIIREENDKGEVTIQKFVNGKEVEVTEQDRQEQQAHWQQDFGGDHEVILLEDGDFEWTEKEGKHNVELKVEMDDEGNVQVQKFVNGEEVEVSDEEMKQLKHGNVNMFILDGENTGDLNIDLDSIMESIQLNVDLLDEEALENGKSRVIIKEIHTGDDTQDHKDFEIKKEMRVNHHVSVNGEESEDFTVVLVHENYDASTEKHTQMHLLSENDNTEINNQGIALNAPISVYPNPNNGTFTIAFEQKNEEKTSVRVVDAQGKVVFKEKLGDFSGAYRKELNLKKHGAGIFIVTVQQGDEISSHKVIVE